METGKPINYVGKNVRIGKNVKIWHFTYIGDNTVIGDNVMIGSLCHIDYNVKIGNNVRIEGSCYIPPLTVIGNNVFIGPATVFTNDPYPPSKRLVGVIVEDDVVIGARSVIKAGVKLGKGCVVAMGSVVTRDVQPNTVVLGNPAKPIYDRSVYENKKKKWEEQTLFENTFNSNIVP
ncbi:MAG: acyltransferase [Nitrososphaeria archaeon]